MGRGHEKKMTKVSWAVVVTVRDWLGGLTEVEFPLGIGGLPVLSGCAEKKPIQKSAEKYEWAHH